MNVRSNNLKLTPREKWAATLELCKAHPRANINELCRIAIDQGLTVSKHFVADARQAVRQAEADSAKTPGLINDVVTASLLRNRPPSKLVLEEEKRLAALERQEEERAAKAMRQAEREAAKEREVPPLLNPPAPALVPAPEPTPPPPPPSPAPAPPIEPDPNEARRRTTAGMMLRRQRLNELLDESPGADPALLMGKLREEFGRGLDWAYVYDTCRVAREIHKLPQLAEYGPHVNPRTVSGAPVPLPKFPIEPEAEVEVAKTPEEELTWLARQAGDIMRAHALTSISLVIENGRAKWKYEVRKSAEGEVTL